MKTTFNACFAGVAMTVLSGCATPLPELPNDPNAAVRLECNPQNFV